jgi:type I restriction enzyme R subunit
MLTWIMFLKFLDRVLEKCATDGKLQFTLPELLQIPPMTQHGNVPQIIGTFGVAGQARNAVNELQTLLYAA